MGSRFRTDRRGYARFLGTERLPHARRSVERTTIRFGSVAQFRRGGTVFGGIPDLVTLIDAEHVRVDRFRGSLQVMLIFMIDHSLPPGKLSVLEREITSCRKCPRLVH